MVVSFKKTGYLERYIFIQNQYLAIKNNSMPSAKKTPTKTTAEVSAENETERLRRDIYRPDMEKFFLFTKMLRENSIKKGKNNL